MYTPINICVTPIISTSTNKIVMFYPLSVVAEMFIMCRFEPPPSIDNLPYMVIAFLYFFPTHPPHFWHFLDNIAPITHGISTDINAGSTTMVNFKYLPLTFPRGSMWQNINISRLITCFSLHIYFTFSPGFTHLIFWWLDFAGPSLSTDISVTKKTVKSGVSEVWNQVKLQNIFFNVTTL